MNQLDIDPLFYGVYGLNGVPIAYHQGAGSRHVATSKVVPGPSRVDGYEDVAFKLDDMVLDVMGQPNGTRSSVTAEFLMIFGRVLYRLRIISNATFVKEAMCFFAI